MKTKSGSICKEILKKCPSIQYFEDFKDQIPEYYKHESRGYNIIMLIGLVPLKDLFYHADPDVTVEQFQSLTDKNARQTVINKVNLSLNKQFTNRWNKQLKGTKSINKAEL